MIMKLSFLLLLPALLALSSASLQDIVKRSSQHRNVSLLKPDLQDRVPELTVNMLVPTRQSPPSPAKLRQKRQAHPFSSMTDSNAKLKWQTWTGSLSNKSVSIYNSYAERTDYVCKHSCHAGFYNPDLGTYCHYPNAHKEYRDSRFEILVNEDDFEVLEWKEGSSSSVPPYSIRTCDSDEIYVGKNRYGLGKVRPRNNAFYLPWEGEEYRYKSYEVLTISRDVESEEISDVKYNITGAEILQHPPETMSVSVITNNECDSVFQRAALSKTSQVEKRWNVSPSLVFGVTSLIVGLPSIASGSIEVGAEVSLQYSREHTYSEETSHSVTVQLTVPPNHYCKALMVKNKYKTNIPFTAQLSRTYRNGEKTRTLITGTYDAIDTGEVRVVVERCKPVTNAKQCPSKTP
ncbi:natterin-3-like [Thunnus thynnus]|uniref:natterin-3-like n=1 Tax=Thunnus thynnus TaxID=8237 RepID=UPI003526D6CD